MTRRRGRDGAWDARLRRTSSALAVALTLVPPVLVAIHVRATAVDVPTWDAWRLAPTVADLAEGRFSPRALWEPHNEHRLVVPRAVMLALAHASDWDVRWEQAANLLVAFAQLAALAALTHRTVTPFAPAATPWLVATTSALIFNLAAWQNWSWGWQIQIFLNVALVSATALGLGAWRARWSQTVGLVVLASAAALSFGTGLAVPLLVPLAMVAVPTDVARRRRLAHAGAAAVAGAALVIAYAHGFTRPPHHPPVSRAFQAPLDAASYGLAYLGAFVAPTDPTLAQIAGTVGLAGVAAGTAWLWLGAPGLRAALLPWMFLETYAVAGGFVTAVGRVGFGVTQALQSRYVTLAAPFWIGAAVTLTLALAHWLRHARPATSATLPTGMIAGALLNLVALGWWSGWSNGAVEIDAHAARMRAGRACLRHHAEAPDDCFVHLHWDPRAMRGIAARLERLGVGPFARFRTPVPLDGHSVASTSPPPGAIESVVLGERHVTVAGWAEDPTTHRHALVVLVAQGARVLGRAWTGLPHAGDGHGPRSGWDLKVPRYRVDPTRPLDAYVVVADGRWLVPLARAPLASQPAAPPGGETCRPLVSMRTAGRGRLRW